MPKVKNMAYCNKCGEYFNNQYLDHCPHNYCKDFLIHIPRSKFPDSPVIPDEEWRQQNNASLIGWSNTDLRPRTIPSSIPLLFTGLPNQLSNYKPPIRISSTDTSRAKTAESQRLYRQW